MDLERAIKWGQYIFDEHFVACPAPALAIKYILSPFDGGAA
jgi:hypothetical protein